VHPFFQPLDLLLAAICYFLKIRKKMLEIQRENKTLAHQFLLKSFRRKRKTNSPPSRPPPSHTQSTTLPAVPLLA
jgi:hypothetical protein